MTIVYDFRITFEDGTRINFNGEGITEMVQADPKAMRHRHVKLITDLNQMMKFYINQNKKLG